MASRHARQPLPGAEQDLFDDAPTMRPTRTFRIEGPIDDEPLELDFDELEEPRPR